METPELDKIAKIKDKSQVIGEFLEWLVYENKYMIAEWKKFDGYEDSQLVSIPLNINKLLEEFFEIDGDKAEKERMAILQAIRSKQQ